MRRLTLIAMAAILSILLAAPAAMATPNRQFRGDVSGLVTYPPGPCLPGVVTTSDARGWFLHLGRAKMHSTHCFAPPNLIVGGEMTLTAANGDQLFVSYQGSASPAMPSVIGEIVMADFAGTITGGTGRFEGATGTVSGVGSVSFPGWEAPAWEATWVISGTVVY